MKCASIAQNGNSSITNQVAPTKKRKFDSIEDAPEEFTMEEKIQLVTGYRLKALDMGMRKRLRTALPESELKDLKAFYDERVKMIIAAKGGA